MAAGTAATGGGAAATAEEPTISMALPKGHMMENVFKLMEDAGLKVRRRAKCRPLRACTPARPPGPTAPDPPRAASHSL